MPDTKDKLISDDMSVLIINTVEKMVTENGAHTINVRQVLKELDITNRVFYNRFHNIDEVLEIIYKRTILKIHECVDTDCKIENENDFFNYVMDIVVSSLTSSYDNKMKFIHYVFENDSISKSNFQWWTTEIKKLIDFAMEKGYIKQVDSEVLSYSIWCFVRGYNADAVARGVPRDEAVARFKYSFGFLLEGLKYNI